MSSKGKGKKAAKEKRNAPAKTTLVPKLRFPEFAGEPIRKVELGDVTEECTTRRGKKSVSMPIKGVSKTDGIVPMEERLIGKDLARYKRVSTDWFAYNPMRINIGSIARWTGEGEVLVSPDYIVFRCVDDSELGISPDYLDQFRSSLQWEKFVSGSGDGGVRIRIYYKDLAQLPLNLPRIVEQQKIAECLSSLDELITAQARKVDELKAHKEGLMQQLFPREGETEPRLRFPEFQNAPAWGNMPLSELVDSLDAGVSVNSGDRPATGDEIGVLKTSAVTNGIFEPQENKVVFDEAEIARVKEPVRADTIIISRMNTPVLVGANAYVEASLENLFLPDRLWAAKAKPGTSMRFVAFILGSAKGRAALSKLAKGSSGSMKNITKPEVLAFSLMAPSPEEQHRIATCLSSLETVITAETQKLDGLKLHKKGLMQQLFPSPEETES